MNAISAVLYRDYRVRRTNPFLLFWDVMAPLAYLVLFGIGYQQLMGNGVVIDGQNLTYTTFLVPGVLGLVTFGIAVNTSWGLYMDKDSGIAQEMLTYPFTPRHMLLGKLGFNVLLALFSSTVLLVVAAAFLNVSLRWEWLAAMLMVTVLAQSAMFFIFYVVAIKIHQMDAYNAIVGVMYVLMMFLSSMFYPLATMPGWFQVVSYVNPITWQVDLLRFALLGLGTSSTLIVKAIVLVSFTLASLIVTLRALRPAE
jgi:ABC-2 type transport system permease protein